MIVAARSSGRRSIRLPLNARPIGERAVATTQASGIRTPSGKRRLHSKDGPRLLCVEVHDSLVSLMGNTPLVRLHSVTSDTPADVLAKVEYFNPGGSVKDRIAVKMIEAAEASGELRAGGDVLGANPPHNGGRGAPQ